MVISENESGFVPGRAIVDNIMVAYEINHHLKQKTQGKIGNVALKLNMSKAYELVEWPFLMRIMEKFGFCGKWVC